MPSKRGHTATFPPQISVVDFRAFRRCFVSSCRAGSCVHVLPTAAHPSRSGSPFMCAWEHGPCSQSCVAGVSPRYDTRPLPSCSMWQIAASCLMAGAYRSVNLSWVDCYYGGASSSGSNVRAVVRTDCRVAMVSCPYVTPAAGIHARRCNVTLVSRFVQRMRPQAVCACVAVLLLTARVHVGDRERSTSAATT